MSRIILLAALAVLTACSGPIEIPLLGDRFVPGRTLGDVAASDGLPAEDQGLTVMRLTQEPAVSPLQAEPGDLWPDPVPPVPTLGQVAAQVRAQEQNGAPPPEPTVTVQPRAPTP